MAKAVKEKGPEVLYRKPEGFFKDALRAALQESLFMPGSLSEAQDVRLKPGFETACWSFQPPHKIFVGDKLFEKPNIRPELTDEQLARYVRVHYHHEQGHALYTERNMGRIKTALTAMSAPFQLFNLMEDAVIEHRYREDNEFQFNWTEYETISFHDRPESLLFAAIQAEGDFERVRAELDAWAPAGATPVTEGLALTADPKEPLNRLLPRVEFYYRRLVKLRSTMAVMPIIKAWLEEFGTPPPPPKNGGMNDMQISIAMGVDPGEREKMEAGTKPLSSKTDDSLEGGKAPCEVNHSSVAESGVVLVDASRSEPLDLARVSALAMRLRPLFKQQVRKSSTTTPNNRFSARHMVMGLSPYRKKALVGKGKKRIFLEIDCSGSMGGMHIEEGRVLVAALSLLARQGYVTGHVALSIVTGGSPRWQTFEFPMADELTQRIGAYGGAEGLEYTLTANFDRAKEADYVFIYTDANICDKPIDKAALHRKGLYTWGLYAGAPEGVLDRMMEFFDKAIIRQNAEELVDAILAQTS